MTVRSVRPAALALAAGLLLAACQPADPAEPGTADPSVDASSTSEPALDTQGADTERAESYGSDPAADPSGMDGSESAASTATGDQPGTPGTNGTDGTAATGPAPAITAALARGCLAAGDEQTVTVTSTPGFQVTVNARYADGQMGNTYGGLAFAQTIGEDGTFTHTWQVSQNAPTGQVTVSAGAQSTTEQHEPHTTTATFRIAHDC